MEQITPRPCKDLQEVYNTYAADAALTEEGNAVLNRVANEGSYSARAIALYIIRYRPQSISTTALANTFSSTPSVGRAMGQLEQVGFMEKPDGRSNDHSARGLALVEPPFFDYITELRERILMMELIGLDGLDLNELEHFAEIFGYTKARDTRYLYQDILNLMAHGLVKLNSHTGVASATQKAMTGWEYSRE